MPMLADLDGDGDLEVVLGGYYGTLSYYQTIGTAASPTFEAIIGNGSPFNGIDVGARSVPGFGDLDGDGDLDLVVGGQDGTIYYYENDGSATWPTYEAVTGSASPFDDIDGSNHPVLADIDGDGDLDLLGSATYENVGSLTSPVRGRRGGWKETGSSIPTGALAVGDLDGDGDLDIVMGSDQDESLYYYENFGSARPASASAAIGDQCSECQTGYFGSTCNLCPEGGSEDRDAPRLTDGGIAGAAVARLLRRACRRRDLLAC
ncbi:calcium ion binding protein [Aureococcus anophagefferens]|nr:calcium ion binding protein [Aureococcus anophagefferens]